ncbi:MAG: DUF3221 domain-containing protein, partial [Candidatus Brocadiales bacterium]
LSIMKSITITLTILTGLFALYIFSCAYSAPSKEEKKANIRGKIAKVTYTSKETRRHGRLCTFMVEGVKPDGTESRALVTVTKETLIFFKQARQTASFKDLKEGLQVDVKFKGPVFQSYPVKATAGEILILEQAGEER